MGKYKILILLIMGLLVAACKKEPLPDLPEENEPYYSVKGYIDGEFINLNVGQEGNFMSKGVTENNGIKSYYGQVVSPSNDLIIKIEFTVPEKSYTAQGVDPFKQNSIDFLVHEPGCKMFDFGSNILQSNYVYIQDENGSFQQTNEVNFSEYGKQNITMKLANLSQETYDIPIYYGFKNEQLNAGFSAYASADTTFFVAYDQDLKHQWFLDGDLISEEAEFKKIIGIGVHKIEHVITDNYGNQANEVSLLRITDFVLDWKMNILDCQGTTAPPNNYGRVIVTAIIDGQEYKSDRVTKNKEHNFTVSNVSFVGNSTSNPDWAVFDFDFESVLSNQNDSDSLSLTLMSGTFNIGLK
ncbi:MAG: hypothetical protein WDZ35_05330 [Crocinitomicaceae bacterium]